jgi:hypothetical protein
VRIGAAAVLWQRRGARLLADTVIVGDDAGQFKMGSHGLFHAERLVHKLDSFSDDEQAVVCKLIWRLDADLAPRCRTR